MTATSRAVCDNRISMNQWIRMAAMSEVDEGAARRATALDTRDIGGHQSGEKPKTGQAGALPAASLIGR